jgi:RNA polymerase sigma-70 factor, ECF subfamily
MTVTIEHTSPTASSNSGCTEAEAKARMRAIHETHSRPLLSFLLRLTLGERQLAEDLLQETMLRAWRHRAMLVASVEELRPWLFTVARRVAVDAARARQARPREMGAVDLATLPVQDDSMERVLTVQAVRQAMGQLSPDHQAVLMAVYYRGRSAAEASVELGIPEGTVKSRTFYALRSLRAAMEQDA